MRVSIFVDGNNTFYALKALGWHMDARKLMSSFRETGDSLVNGFWYMGIDPNDESQNKFKEALTGIGYTVRVKGIKEWSTAGKTTFKANLDVEMVLDMLNTVELYDHAVILSGDSDFEKVVEHLRTKGKKVTVVSTTGNVSWELVNASDSYVDLKNMKDALEKTFK